MQRNKTFGPSDIRLLGTGRIVPGLQMGLDLLKQAAMKLCEQVRALDRIASFILALFGRRSRIYFKIIPVEQSQCLLRLIDLPWRSIFVGLKVIKESAHILYRSFTQRHPSDGTRETVGSIHIPSGLFLSHAMFQNTIEVLSPEIHHRLLSLKSLTFPAPNSRLILPYIISYTIP